MLLYIELTSPRYAYSHLYKPFAVAEFECLDKSPFRYFLGELYGGNSLGSTIAVGNEKKRQRVYNTMFHVPWRCERVCICTSNGNTCVNLMYVIWTFEYWCCSSLLSCLVSGIAGKWIQYARVIHNLAFFKN